MDGTDEHVAARDGGLHREYIPYFSKSVRRSRAH